MKDNIFQKITYSIWDWHWSEIYETEKLTVTYVLLCIAMAAIPIIWLAGVPVLTIWFLIYSGIVAFIWCYFTNKKYVLEYDSKPLRVAAFLTVATFIVCFLLSI